MCGRFTLQIPVELLAELFGLRVLPAVPPRYNIAPTQQVAVVRQLERGGNRLDFLRWGLVPHWAKELSIGARMINARSETLEEKPAFRSALRHRRCLVPASGFYEWQTVAGRKVPQYLRLKGGAPMLFAGLWESWAGPGGEIVETCTILTTEANALVQPLHDRMPVILRPEECPLWLDRGLTAPEKLKGMFRPYPAGEMEGRTVSTLANSPKNDLPELLDPVVTGPVPLGAPDAGGGRKVKGRRGAGAEESEPSLFEPMGGER